MNCITDLYTFLHDNDDRFFCVGFENFSPTIVRFVEAIEITGIDDSRVLDWILGYNCVDIKNGEISDVIYYNKLSEMTGMRYDPKYNEMFEKALEEKYNEEETEE